MSKPYVIAGVSGHTGRVVAEELLKQKKPLRVIVRDAARGAEWKAKGAEVAVADLGDVAALTEALKGGEAAYLLSPPKVDAADFVADRRQLLDGVARAVKASGIPHVVFLSSFGAHLPSGTGPIMTVRHAEEVVGNAAPSVTFLRPPYFLDNWGSVVGAVTGNGVLPTFLPAALAIPQIASHDVGLIGARELLVPGKGRKIVEFQGPTASSDDVARAFSQILGKPVAVSVAPNAAVVPTFMSFGLGQSIASLYAEMYASMEAGTMSFEKPGSVEKLSSSLVDGLKPLLG